MNYDCSLPLNLKDWLEQHSGYETVVDGANVGLYQQNFAQGGFSIAQVLEFEFFFGIVSFAQNLEKGIHHSSSILLNFL